MSDDVTARTNNKPTRPQVITYRRATAADYRAVLEINSNVYDGLDYVPPQYFNFIHDSRHTMYVVEADGEIVFFMAFARHGNILSGMGARTKASHQHQRLGLENNEEFRRYLQEHHFDVINSYGVLYLPLRKMRMKFSTVYGYRLMAYRMEIKSINSQHLDISADQNLTVLSYTESLRILNTTDAFETFINLYVRDVLPLWVPYVMPINKKGLRETFSRGNVVVSWEHPETRENLEMSALSIGCVAPLQIGLSYDMVYFGDCTKLESHLTCHISQLEKIIGDTVYLTINLPISVDFPTAERELRKVGLTEERLMFKTDVIAIKILGGLKSKL